MRSSTNTCIPYEAYKLLKECVNIGKIIKANRNKRYKYILNLSNIYSLTPDTDAHVSGMEKESKRSTDSPAPLSFDMMFKTTEQQYGFGLHSPEQNDYDLYKR